MIVDHPWDQAQHRAETATTISDLADAIYDLAVYNDHGSSPGLEETLLTIRTAIKTWVDRMLPLIDEDEQ